MRFSQCIGEFQLYKTRQISNFHIEYKLNKILTPRVSHQSWGDMVVVCKFPSKERQNLGRKIIQLCIFCLLTSQKDNIFIIVQSMEQLAQSRYKEA